MFSTRRTTSTPDRSGKSDSVADTISKTISVGLELISAEVQLVRNEVQREITAEILLTRRLIIASAVIVVGSSLLLFGLTELLAKVIPVWMSAICLGVILLASGTSVGVLSWRRRKTLSQIGAELEAELFGSGKPF